MTVRPSLSGVTEFSKSLSRQDSLLAHSVLYLKLSQILTSPPFDKKKSETLRLFPGGSCTSPNGGPKRPSEKRKPTEKSVSSAVRTARQTFTCASTSSFCVSCSRHVLGTGATPSSALIASSRVCTAPRHGVRSIATKVISGGGLSHQKTGWKQQGRRSAKRARLPHRTHHWYTLYSISQP